jgi:hypothetical protein
MFNLQEKTLTPIEENVLIEDMEQKYHDKMMLVVNCGTVDGRIKGDIVALFSQDEYRNIDLPKPLPYHCSIWRGFSLKVEGVGMLF